MFCFGWMCLESFQIWQMFRAQKIKVTDLFPSPPMRPVWIPRCTSWDGQIFSISTSIGGLRMYTSTGMWVGLNFNVSQFLCENSLVKSQLMRSFSILTYSYKNLDTSKDSVLLKLTHLHLEVFIVVLPWRRPWLSVRREKGLSTFNSDAQKGSSLNSCNFPKLIRATSGSLVPPVLHSVVAATPSAPSPVKKKWPTSRNIETSKPVNRQRWQRSFVSCMKVFGIWCPVP